MGKLDGKNVVVTGGSTGIGFASARRFIQEGARVIITGRNADTLNVAKLELGENAITVQGDVSDLEDLDRLATVAKDEFGSVDVIFANAGIARFTPIEMQTPEDFHQQFSVNVLGAFFAVQKLLPLLGQGASILFTTSVASSKGMANTSVYSGTKGALRSIARSLAVELAPKGIRVNVVSPGPVETPIFGKMGMPQEALDEFAKGIGSMVPLGRFGRPDELANAALFLASSESSFVTGAELVVDGGINEA